FFQLPGLPEMAFRAFDHELVERALRRGIRRQEVLDQTDFLAYVEEVSHPGALTAMLNYYRAAARGFPRTGHADREFHRRVHAPALVLWGERDPWLSPRLLRGLERWAPAVRIERLPGVGHFPHQEAHEDVNRLLLGFLRE